jgi:hypothetical protein
MLVWVSLVSVAVVFARVGVRSGSASSASAVARASPEASPPAFADTVTASIMAITSAVVMSSARVAASEGTPGRSKTSGCASRVPPGFPSRGVVRVAGSGDIPSIALRDVRVSDAPGAVALSQGRSTSKHRSASSRLEN